MSWHYVTIRKTRNVKGKTIHWYDVHEVFNTDGKDKGRVYSYNEQQGMTLRDYFAGQALLSFLGQEIGKDKKVIAKYVSEICYIYADAMLAERMKYNQ